MLDVILRGGSVIDGTGAEPRPADVAIADSRIADIGSLPGATAATIVDCTGRYVLPGFIDAHSHADATVFDGDVQLALMRQGVTTVVAGQDGVSFAPGDGRYARGYFGALNGEHPHYRGSTVADLLRTYDGTTPVNVAYLVPHGTIRYQTMGYANRPPTPDELAEMSAAVADGLEQGAVGLSSGLDYVPGRLADTGELAALCEPVARAGALYVTHMRGRYEHNAGIGVAEVRAIAEHSGVQSHISHYHGPAALLAGLVDEALAAGIDLTFDSYPYRRGNSLLAMLTLPEELQALGVDEGTRRLADPATRSALLSDWLPALPERLGLGADWADRITLTHVAAGEFTWAGGHTLQAAADQSGRTTAEFIVDVLTTSRLAVAGVFAFPSTTSLSDVSALLRHPAHMAGSDGIFIGVHPHPRAWGTFGRLLGRHTRELGDYTWGMAARHLAAQAAQRFALGQRGLIRAGFAADLAVVDPGVVRDMATYEDPRRPAVGIDDVLVNGRLVLRNGQLTGANAGQGLRRYT